MREATGGVNRYVSMLDAQMILHLRPHTDLHYGSPGTPYCVY